MVANFEETNNQCVNFYNSELHAWKGLKFRSKSEIKIAEELDRRGIFFLPNCAGRVGVGSIRRNVEADFLIHHSNVWGILEVDGERYHTDSHADQVRDNFLKESISVCIIQRYDSERCFYNSKGVVDHFLYLMEEEYGKDGFILDIVNHIFNTRSIHDLKGFKMFWWVYKQNFGIKDDVVEYYFKLQQSILELDGGTIEYLIKNCPNSCLDVTFFISSANDAWQFKLNPMWYDVEPDWLDYLDFMHKFNKFLHGDFNNLITEETKQLFIKMSQSTLSAIPLTGNLNLY